MYRGGGSGTPDRGEDEERVLDLGASLDVALGFSAGEAYILLVVDPLAGGVQAYGTYSEDDVRDAADEMREQFRDIGIEGVSVNILPLHSPGS